MDDNYSDAATRGLTRREALKRGAVVAGALWAVPVVQAVGIRPAYATQPSPGCRRYCLKWEPHGPSGGPTCPPDPGEDDDFLIPWTGGWSELGGKPDDEQVTDTTADAAPPDTPPDDTKGKSDKATGDGGGEKAAKPKDPPEPPPGNCLECPPDGINELPHRVRRFLMDNVAFYGLPETGFLVTFPPSVILVTAAAKCGSEQSSEPGSSPCNTNHGAGSDCEGDESRSSFFVRSCTNGKAISHLEFIVDIC